MAGPEDPAAPPKQQQRWWARPRTALRVAAALVVVAGVVAVVAALPVKDWLVAALTTISGLGPAGPFAFAAICVGTSLFAIPFSFMAACGGFAFAIPVSIAAVSTGCTAGALTAFLLARGILREWVQDWVRGHPRYSVLDRLVAEKGARIIVLCRLSPLVPSGGTNYGMGATDVALWRFTAASWVGMLPLITLYTFVGSSVRAVVDLVVVGSIGRSPAELAFFITGCVLTAIGVAWATVAARRALAREWAAAEEEAVASAVDGEGHDAVPASAVDDEGHDTVPASAVDGEGHDTVPAAAAVDGEGHDTVPAAVDGEGHDTVPASTVDGEGHDTVPASAAVDGEAHDDAQAEQHNRV